MPTKSKTVYVCQQCGAQHPKWLGRCTSCQAWDSLVEESVAKSPGKGAAARSTGARAIPLTEIPTVSENRIQSGMSEFNRVLGGGIVEGSLTLIGGEPGIGKSTLLLQVAGGCAAANLKSNRTTWRR